MPETYTTIKIRQKDHQKLIAALVKESARLEKRLTVVAFTEEVLRVGIEAIENRKR
jgi:hypothetical protein